MSPGARARSSDSSTTVIKASPVFVDSSCFVALALGEPGSVRLKNRLLRASGRFAAALAEAEVLAALTRERVSLSTAPLAGVEWVSPSRRLSRELDRVLATGYVRGADAWHLACALFLDPEAAELAFLTLDERQREVATALGFRTA